MLNRLTTKNFIEKAIVIHGDKYDYSSVEYSTAHTKVLIHCKIPGHEPFWQKPNTHLNGCGCKRCGKLNSIKASKLTTEKFIEKAIVIYGDKYDYTNSIYIDSHSKIEILCKVPGHDPFWQTPNNHLNNHGCQKCGNLLTRAQKIKPVEQFLQEAESIHQNKYDYSKIRYVDRSTKIEILCKVPSHDPFWQTPNNHVHSTHPTGCPMCRPNVSKKEIAWLKSFNNDNILTQHRIQLNETTYVVADGYDPITNTIYEYHGKYWHGHPDRSDPDEIIKDKSAGDRYIETLMREIRLKDLGYNLISFWGY
jgi:hypothetical protein